MVLCHAPHTAIVCGYNNPYAYTGREYDDEDLYYYRARYYDPTTQRFLSKDPIGFAGGDFNLYRYVQNDPVNWIDPFGLENVDPIDVDYGGPGAWKPPPRPPINIGNAISQPNGNVWGTPGGQDDVCTLPGVIGTLADACVLDRCQRHDDCYADNGCTASSWISSALGGDQDCNECNSGFFE